MEFIVLRVSKETTNGNVILTLLGKERTPFGVKTRSYLTAVESGTQPEAESVIKADISLFEVVERTWTDEEGKEVTNKWLHLKDN